MQVSSSVKLAGLIFLLILLYFLVRGLLNEDVSGAGEVAAEDATFTVLAAPVAAQEWRNQVVIRGRTKAEKKVVLRAETPGAIAETPTELGAAVKAGDVICRLKEDARRARLAEARAALEKARLDYNAAVELGKDGFRSDTAVAAARAARDQAAAAREQAQLELEKTKITAPFDGVFDGRFVEVGDFLSVGDPCGTVIKSSPFLVVGAVSERDVSKIAKGDRGVARLATGETIEGVVRFVAASADPSTRTFDVELEVPNEDGALRDGVTADFTVFAKRREAVRVPRSSIILNDNGEIGVRIVDNDNIVAFQRVALIGEEPAGVWVDGLPSGSRLITRGQEYVSAGQEVSIGAIADGSATP